MGPHAASRFNHIIRGAANHRHSLTPNGHISPFISASVRLLIPASSLHLSGPASINPNAANLFPVAAPLRHSCSCVPLPPPCWLELTSVCTGLAQSHRTAQKKKTSHGEESAGPVTRPQTWKKKEGNLIQKPNADAQTQWLVSLIKRWKDEINEMEEGREDRTGRILSRGLKLKGQGSAETAVYMVRCAFVSST